MGKTMLRRLRLDRVDLVDDGAQPDAHIALFKRRSDGPETLPAPRVVAVKMTDPGSIDGLLDRIRSAFWAQRAALFTDGGWYWIDHVYDSFVIVCGESTTDLYRVAYTVDGDGAVTFGQPEAVTIEFVTKAADDAAATDKEPRMTLDEILASLDETARKTVTDAIEANAAELAAAVERAETAEKALAAAGGPDDDEDDDDPVVKSLPAEARAEIVKAREAAAEAQAEVAKIRDEQALATTVAKAKADYGNIGEAAELGGVLHRASKALDADDVATLDRLLKAANARIDTGALFAEAGVGGQPSDALSAEIAKHRAAGLSQADATAKALDEHPELFTA